MVLRKKVFLILLLVNVTLFLSYLYMLGQNVAVEEDYEFVYSPNFTIPFSPDMLDENLNLCWLNPSYKPDKIVENSVEISLLRQHNSFLSSTEKVRFKVLMDFSDLMSFLNVETVLIEPLILFCMISPLLKNQLVRRKFDLKKLRNSKRVWTFGIHEEHISVLEEVEAQEQIKSSGFSIDFIKEPQMEWMFNTSTISRNESLYCSHVILNRNEYFIHLVVFYNRGNFLWHAEMRANETQNIPPKKELIFVESDSAFERFSLVSLGFKEKSWSNISIPANPQFFLFEMVASEFLECNRSIVLSFIHQNSRVSDSKGDFSTSSERFFQRRSLVALQELKALFNPLLIQFWIWSGTLLGWYRQCGIISYTSDIDFASWAADVEDLDQLTQPFFANSHLLLRERMGLVGEGLELHLECHKLRVDVFFMYNENNGTWYAGHRPGKGYYFRYHHPKLKLCSAELLGHKVLVPCNAEEVITTEYGPNWSTPVHKWDYEHSVYNRGPNIYWNKEVLNKVYAY